MPSRRRRFRVFACVVLLLQARTAAAKCDTVAFATALAEARAAIDAACPCAVASKPSAHVKCASAVVAARIANGSLDTTCKSEALVHAKKSVCGRPGSAVCYRYNVFNQKLWQTAAYTIAQPELCRRPDLTGSEKAAENGR
jgi:hypothetical protein